MSQRSRLNLTPLEDRAVPAGLLADGSFEAPVVPGGGPLALRVAPAGGPPGHPDDEGKRARAAKDRPGRHDDSYGARGGPAAGAAAPREVRSEQGARSFAPKRGGSARRRPV